MSISVSMLLLPVFFLISLLYFIVNLKSARIDFSYISLLFWVFFSLSSLFSFYFFNWIRSDELIFSLIITRYIVYFAAYFILMFLLKGIVIAIFRKEVGSLPLIIMLINSFSLMILCGIEILLSLINKWIK